MINKLRMENFFGKFYNRFINFNILPTTKRYEYVSFIKNV